MPLFYRIQQLVRALTGSISADEHTLIAALLSDAEQRAFSRMAHFDQRHCLDVAETLQQSGQDHVALLRAALLHDIGKVDDTGRPIPLLYYGAFVVLQRLSPRLYRRAAAIGRGPLRPFATHAAHERRSVALARAAGSSTDVIAILEDYAERRITVATKALRWADDRN